MTLLPVGPQYGVKHTLIGPDGTTAVFNDDTDPNYVGMLTETTGFDSPDVRENADDLVEMDGGLHGNFFYGRRPITMSGLSFGHESAAERNMRMTRLMQATNAMRADATLLWQADGGAPTQFMTLRRQQPLRITGGWNKEFQIAMVAADPRIYSAELHSATVGASQASGSDGMSFDMGFDMDFGLASVTGQVLIENVGNHTSYPIITVKGPGTNPAILNATTGQVISLFYTLGADETFVIDTLNRTVKLNGTVNRYSVIDFNATSWWGLLPGTNDIRLLYNSAGASANMQVDWRDAWL